MSFKIKNTVGSKGFVSYRNDNSNSTDEFIVESELKFQNIDTTTKHFYLSVSGSDNNDGLSSITPIKTTNKIVDLISGIWFRPVVVNVYAGEYDLDPLTTGKGINFIPASLGASLHWVGHDKKILMTGSIMSGSTSFILKTSDIGSTNYSGYEIEFTSGTYNKFRRTIQQSNSGSLTFGATFSPIPSVDDTFQIFEPAAIFKRNTISSPSNAIITLPFGIPTGFKGNGELSRQQKSLCTVTNVLFQNASPTYSGVRLTFCSEFALYGVMFRDFSRVAFTGNGSAGDSSTWHGSKSPTVSQYASTDPIAETLSLPSGTLATGIFAYYGVSSDTNLATTMYHDNGVVHLGALVTDVFVGYDQSWAWTVGEYVRLYHEVGYDSYAYIQSGAKIGGNTFGLYVGNKSQADLITVNAVVSGSPTAITCVNNGIVNINGTSTIISGSTYSLRARQGSIYFNNSTILSGNVALGDDSALSSTVLNMKTGVTASAILSSSVFTAAGDSYSNGTAAVTRRN